MTTRELAELVRTMRKAQKGWYLYHRQPDLAEAKRLEREVDRVVERELGPRAERTLFDVKEAGT